MPRKLSNDKGASRQLAAALPSSEDETPKAVPEKKVAKQEKNVAPTPSQIRTTIFHDSPLGREILKEVNRVNELAGRNLLSPNKLASEFIRESNDELSKLFKAFLKTV